MLASRIAVARRRTARKPSARPARTGSPAMGTAFDAWGVEYAHALTVPAAHHHTVAHAPPIVDGAGLALVSAAARKTPARASSLMPKAAATRAIR